MNLALAHERAAPLKLMCFDVDGVMTDGSLYFSPDGEVFKRFHALDGHGIKLLHDAGVASAIISGRSTPAVNRRAADLGIRYVYQGVQNKLERFEALVAELSLAPEQVGFMGDDVIDLGVLVRCGFPVSVSEAPEAVRSRAVYVATRPAGHGAVRQVCDFILQAQGKYDAMIERCLSGAT
jgi:3-deoxy-D-manno-octulosonate 8-phosphate phosphatase (KDO 8-P phosphatase)